MYPTIRFCSWKHDLINANLGEFKENGELTAPFNGTQIREKRLQQREIDLEQSTDEQLRRRFRYSRESIKNLLKIPKNDLQRQIRRNHALSPTIHVIAALFWELLTLYFFCHSLYFTRVSGWPVYESLVLVFYLTLALAWFISCCFSLVSVWICCSWACLSCSSCLRKASSHAFNLSTAELKTRKKEDYVNEKCETIKFPGNLVPRLFQGPSHFLTEKPWGRGWFTGSLFSYRPAHERLARDATGDEKHAGSPATVG